ncbi:hypothetical protein GIB67_035829 [Kingdonia uniflora]|uniref:Uncharacterized protein n=1 Tax=Kingdonia uniflora TaxID=39325 RepID=A0A7J7MJU1_9MAGN|nr:hypothetical protein GIB67_035829 [Kingdonia uniflora]
MTLLSPSSKITSSVMSLRIGRKLLILITSIYKLNEFGIFWEPYILTKSSTLYMTTTPLWMRHDLCIFDFA